MWRLEGAETDTCTYSSMYSSMYLHAYMIHTQTRQEDCSAADDHARGLGSANVALRPCATK